MGEWLPWSLNCVKMMSCASPTLSHPRDHGNLHTARFQAVTKLTRLIDLFLLHGPTQAFLQ